MHRSNQRLLKVFFLESAWMKSCFVILSLETVSFGRWCIPSFQQFVMILASMQQPRSFYYSFPSVFHFELLEIIGTYTYIWMAMIMVKVYYFHVWGLFSEKSEIQMFTYIETCVLNCYVNTNELNSSCD